MSFDHAVLNLHSLVVPINETPRDLHLSLGKTPSSKTEDSHVKMREHITQGRGQSDPSRTRRAKISHVLTASTSIERRDCESFAATNRWLKRWAISRDNPGLSIGLLRALPRPRAGLAGLVHLRIRNADVNLKAKHKMNYKIKGDNNLNILKNQTSNFKHNHSILRTNHHHQWETNIATCTLLRCNSRNIGYNIHFKIQSIHSWIRPPIRI